MSDQSANRNVLQEFAEVISLLEKNWKYVDSLGMDSTTIQDYRKVISFLKSRSEPEIRSILLARASAKKESKNQDSTLTDAEIVDLCAEKIKALISAPDSGRKLLERIATLRFAVTRGALSNLRTRDALRDKLTTLLSNEGAHAAIARLIASQEPANGPDG